MISMMIWVIAMAGSIAAICLTVAFDAQSAHLTATALISFSIVAAAVSDHRAAELGGAASFSLAATAARYMGLLWSWSAISAFVAYEFLLEWPYWMPAVFAMFTISAVCLFVALILDREAAANNPDVWARWLAHLVSVGHFVFSGLLMGSAVAARTPGDMLMGGAPKWVALNLVLSTSAALLTFTGYLILTRRVDTAVMARDTAAISVASA